ncbi:hypothetical protein ACFCXH_12030, partial [Streptomyces nojiriensis]
FDFKGAVAEGLLFGRVHGRRAHAADWAVFFADPAAVRPPDHPAVDTGPAANPAADPAPYPPAQEKVVV